MAIEVLIAHEVDLSATTHNSDRGCQYTSADYISVLRQYKMIISMTESGNPKDNPEAERVNNTLKNELFKDMAFSCIEDVREAMETAVPFYNSERPHRSIEMLTPIEAAGRTGRFRRGWTSYREKAIDNMNRERCRHKFFCNFALSKRLADNDQNIGQYLITKYMGTSLWYAKVWSPVRAT